MRGGGGGGWCQKAVQNARELAKHGVLPSLAVGESGPACVICSLADGGLHKVVLVHTVNLEYHSVCPLVWIIRTPSSPASEFAPPPPPPPRNQRGEGTHSPACEPVRGGGGESQFGRLETGEKAFYSVYSVVVCIAAPDGPYWLSGQELLSCEILAIPAAAVGILVHV